MLYGHCAQPSSSLNFGVPFVLTSDAFWILHTVKVRGTKDVGKIVTSQVWDLVNEGSDQDELSWPGSTWLGHLLSRGHLLQLRQHGWPRDHLLLDVATDTGLWVTLLVWTQGSNKTTVDKLQFVEVGYCRCLIINKDGAVVSCDTTHKWHTR